jgi:F-type H+-transporting ATPase subunit epsilon
VSGGFIEVSNNVISIIAPAAEKSTDIDFARAEAAKQRAQERIAKKENIDMARAQAALARANARLSVR